MDITTGNGGVLTLTFDDWSAHLRGLCPQVVIDGKNQIDADAVPVDGTLPDGSAGRVWNLAYGGRLLVGVRTESDASVQVTGWLHNATDFSCTLDRVTVFETAHACFGDETDGICQYVHHPATSSVLPLRTDSPEVHTTVAGEPNTHDDGRSVPADDPEYQKTFQSHNLWMGYDRKARRSLLAGFLTCERWDGMVHVTTTGDGSVSRWSMEYDGGELLVQPGEVVKLETVVVMAGQDPHALLERYGDSVARTHGVDLPEETPVSWCSWYPYRLGVTQERVLANARIAERRLKPLGLRVVEVDLGWENDYLPSSFDPNDQFPDGMARLGDTLREMGFDLGVWKAPYAVSEFDPVAREHPDWLIRDDAGNPVSAWTWFWEPHGNVYVWDLTKPGVFDYLRSRFRELHRDWGVRYFKSDFSAFATHPVGIGRSDKRCVQGKGLETARRYWEMANHELPDALKLNCFGPQLPGTGQWRLLYCCNDTGNTGVLTWDFIRSNYQAVAAHLWKNRRWAIIQPSCLCVGLPGTLEEARIRATVAFFAGGQVDISDSLSTLPEDRWRILEATLPPLGISAKAIDLFDPVFDPGTPDYEAQCKGEHTTTVPSPHPLGSVWHLHVDGGWDSWELVAVFNLDNAHGNSLRSVPRHYRIPLARLGMDTEQRYWSSEFWSEQHLGQLRGRRRNPRGYEHPGDLQDLFTGSDDGAVDISFAGPAVKLLCLRTVREHPWVAATTFHQGCGAELTDVKWEKSTGVLSGTLRRPAGLSGAILFATPHGGWKPREARVGAAVAQLIPAANGGWKLPIVTMADTTLWSVHWQPADS